MKKATVVLVVALLAFACSKKSGSAASSSSPKGAATTTAAAPPPPSCKDVADCTAQCAKDPASCGQAGWLTFKAGDGKGALPLLQKACDANLANYCFTAGQILGSGSGGVKKDEKASQPFLEKACTLKHAKSCAMAAAIYFDEGKTKNEKKGIELEGEACTMGFAPACRQTAADMIKAKDHKAAMPMAQLGCDAKDANSCALLGSLLEEEKQNDKAKAAYASACTGGYKDACAWKDNVGKPHPAPTASNDDNGSSSSGGGDDSSAHALTAEDTKTADCKAKGDHYAMCDEDCVDLSSSHDNCGACKASCRSDESCEESLSFGIKCKEPDGTYDDPQ